MPLESQAATRPPRGVNSTALGRLLERPELPRLSVTLRGGLSGSLTMGLRLLLRRASEVGGSAPPKTSTALAASVGCHVNTLATPAKHLGLDLPAICRAATLRWVVLQLATTDRATHEITFSAGFEATRSLRRFVRDGTGSPLSQVSERHIVALDQYIRTLLHPVLEGTNWL